MSEARIDPQAPGSNIHHVYPIEAREHVLEGTGCWCGPDLYRLCTACDGDDSDCWACEGEEIVRIAAIIPGDRVIVVHRFLESREETHPVHGWEKSHS